MLFVVDAMVGQDAVNTAEAFRDGVGFTGVVLTKLDGDARGGAALSVRDVTGQPIMFASNGEKLEDFDVFHPDRMASRILGMGDMLTLIEQAEQTFDEDEAEKMAAKLAAGNQFTLEDFLDQLHGDPQDGPDRQPARHDARHGADEGRDQPGRRHATSTAPPRSSASMTPAERDEPEDHQRLAPAAHRQRLRRHGQRRQPARRPVLRGPQDDGADGRHGMPGMRKRTATKSSKNKRKGKGKKGGGRGPTQPRMPAGFPGGFPGGLPGGMPQLPPGQFPPGMDPDNLPDLTKLKFPKQP